MTLVDIRTGDPFNRVNERDRESVCVHVYVKHLCKLSFNEIQYCEMGMYDFVHNGFLSIRRQIDTNNSVRFLARGHQGR